MAKKAATKQAIKAVVATTVEESNGEDLTIHSLSREQISQAGVFNREQALALVGLYYSIQKLRVGQSNRVSAEERNVDFVDDTALVIALKEDMHLVEKQAARGLAAYAKAQPLGQWCLSHLGVGPVITAALLAHIDLHRALTAGAIWKFAGLDPTVVWEPGKKRPYNAPLKTLCWKLGESFKKVSGREDAYYGQVYKKRKAREERNNSAGVYREVALATLDKRTKKRSCISPEQREIWSSGKLQAIGLDLRAMRYTVKLFLSHFHEVGRKLLGLDVPVPWILENDPRHTHYLPPPNWPMPK